MDTTLVIVLVVAAIAVLAIAAAAWAYNKKKSTENLRTGFGPEYERTVEEQGDRGKAEAELKERQKRVDKLDIRALTANESEAFAKSWAATQARFVDSPEQASGEADKLVTEVMEARGYPVGDFEQRAADVSVDHPQFVENYRSARRIADANERGEATTEDLRQGMVNYRALFDDLLGTGTSTTDTSNDERKAEEARR